MAAENKVGPLTNCKKKLRLTFSGFQPPLKIDDVAFEMRQGVGLLIKCLSMLPTHYKRCAKNCHESFRAETHPLWHFLFRQSNISAWWSKAKKKNKMESFFSSQNITTAKAWYSRKKYIPRRCKNKPPRPPPPPQLFLFWRTTIFSRCAFSFLLTAKMAFCPPQKSLHDNYRNDGNDDKWKTIG